MGGSKGRGNNLWKKAMKEESTLVTAEQLSLLLNVSEFTIKKLARLKELPSTYAKGKIVFPLEKILDRLKELEGGAA
jgi:hypothetical protein